MERIDFRKFSPVPVAGVDEVGRGCLAGPVYAAAVCFNEAKLRPFGKKQKKSEPFLFRERDYVDSKSISESRRELLADFIFKNHWFGVGIASVEEIEQHNILWASHLAMVRALEELQKKMHTKVGHVVVDGHLKLRHWTGSQTAIIKGDHRCSLISAASIVAKVTRDRWMKQLDSEYPHYEFKSNKGYPSKTHRTAIQNWGITQYHRRSFKGVREWLEAGTAGR